MNIDGKWSEIYMRMNGSSVVTCIIISSNGLCSWESTRQMSYAPLLCCKPLTPRNNITLSILCILLHRYIENVSSHGSIAYHVLHLPISSKCRRLLRIEQGEAGQKEDGR
jgi:hypothetical protein